MAKLFIIPLLVFLTGCSTAQTAYVVKEPDFRTPEQVRRDRGTADNLSSGRSTVSTVNLPSGTYLVGRQGNSVSVIQTSRGR